MKDPKPENIVGQKTVSHTVEHRIDWGYVTAGIGALFIGYVLYKMFVQSGSDEQKNGMEVIGN